MDNQVDAEGRHDLVRMGDTIGVKTVANLLEPDGQFFLRAGVEGRKGADDPGRALRDDEVDA